MLHVDVDVDVDVATVMQATMQATMVQPAVEAVSNSELVSCDDDVVVDTCSTPNGINVTS